MNALIHVVAAVLRNNKGEILVQQRSSDRSCDSPADKHLGGGWEFPGGKVEVGERSWDALVREIREELGTHITNGQRLIRYPVHNADHYPGRIVDLDVWEVTEWRQAPRPCEGQNIEWHDIAQLKSFPGLLSADKPVVRAVQLPHRYLVTPNICGSVDSFVSELVDTVDRHHIRLCVLRQTDCDISSYRDLATKIKPEFDQRSCQLLLHGIERQDLVVQVGADGLHLRSIDLQAPGLSPNLSGRFEGWLAASCHSGNELEQARQIGVDFVVLGHVKATASHAEKPGMGWTKFSELVAELDLPIFAIGGMTLADEDNARSQGAQGIAAISAFRLM